MTTLTLALDAPRAGSLDDARALMGGKAANLGVMARDLGLPVPSGFVITTEACRTVLEGGWPAGLDDEDFADVALRVRPDQLMAPGLVDPPAGPGRRLAHDPRTRRSPAISRASRDASEVASV